MEKDVVYKVTTSSGRRKLTILNARVFLAREIEEFAEKFHKGTGCSYKDGEKILVKVNLRANLFRGKTSL